MSNPKPSTAPAPRWFGWIALLVLLGYGIFLGVNFTPAAGGSDSSGYLNAARLLASGHLTGTLRLVPGLAPDAGNFVQPLGFLADAAQARLTPTYPLGLPAHLALASAIAGWTVGPLLIGVGAVLAAMALCYFCARELDLSWPLAAAGAVMLGVFPITLYIAIQPLSDVLATTWTLAALAAALRARRLGLQWAFASGAALAVAVFVRPTNILFIPALIVLLSGNLRLLAVTALGGLPGAVLLAWCNYHLYGSPWQMGYTSIFEAFAREYFAPTLVHFGYWLAVLMPTVLLILPFVALKKLRGQARLLIALTLWFALPVAVYACYEISHQVWWCLRFILPAIPALILGALLGLQSLFTTKPRAIFLSAAGLSVWAVVTSWAWTAHFHSLMVPTYERAYIEVGQWTREHLPAESIIACMADSGAIYYYTSFPVLRWDQMDPAGFLRSANDFTLARRPLYALVFPSEEKEMLTTYAPGRWEKAADVAGRGIWRYTGVTAVTAP